MNWLLPRLILEVEKDYMDIIEGTGGLSLYI